MIVLFLIAFGNRRRLRSTRSSTRRIRRWFLLIWFNYFWDNIDILYWLRKYILNVHLCFYLFNPSFQRLSCKIWSTIINYWCSAAAWNDIVQRRSIIAETRQGVFPVENVCSFLKHFRWCDLLPLKLVHLFLSVCSKWLYLTRSFCLYLII